MMETVRIYILYMYVFDVRYIYIIYILFWFFSDSETESGHLSGEFNSTLLHHLEGDINRDDAFNRSNKGTHKGSQNEIR